MAVFKILHNEMIVPNIHLLQVEAADVARQIEPGQFVILRAEPEGERVPLSVSDWNPQEGTITVVFMNVGRTTNRLASLQAGQSLPTVVGPLGNPTEIERYGTVLCLGGCYGIGSIYPLARALKEKKNTVLSVIEARSQFLLYWQDRLGEVSDVVVAITRDGTQGIRGHVARLPEIVRTHGPVDRLIVNGCTYLLRRASQVSRPLKIKTIVSLNPIMIDGTGMCGVCRVSVGGATKFACVDGPDFDGHQVDWDELAQRRKTYVPEEVVASRAGLCGGHAS
jgi:ferredoxin--NADP+ reductase